jgi:putative ABC transport system permease protein
LHDKVRLAVTLMGIVFAVVLISAQLGLFLGFLEATSNVIEHAGADLWVAAKDIVNFDAASPFPDRRRFQVLSVPGVAKADNVVVQFATWKRPSGGSESVEIVGFDLTSRLAAPWNLTAGRVEDLWQADTVIIDELYKDKLGVSELGQTVEINNRRARIVGFTRGIRSFTTAPYVFTAFENGRKYLRLRSDQTIYVVVKAAPGTDLAQLKERLLKRVPGVDVYTTAEFRSKTRFYWMITTGAGASLLTSAVMGVIVGTAVVAQTIYATTVDHLREFGTLKAMGAANSFVYRVIIEQALWSATIGYALGIGISLMLAALSQQSATLIRLPWEVVLLLFGLTLAMCAAAGLISINKVTRLEPVMVFKG